MDQALLKLIDYGGVGIVAVVALTVMVWLIRELQKNFDSCNERVDKLLDSHTKFVSSVSNDINELLVKVEELLETAEAVLKERSK